MSGANAARAPALLQKYGCAACHTIPGIATPRGQVGPSLAQLSRHAYIAAALRNEPGTHVAAQDARDIAAYLYVLQ